MKNKKMKTHAIFIMIILLKAGCALAQTTERMVYATAGGSYNGNFSIDYTIGETFIETYYGTNFMLTQGFEQPDLINLTAVQEKNTDDLVASVFPNPTQDLIHIDIENSLTGTLGVEIYDITGRLMITREFDLYQEMGSRIAIDLSSFATGTYLVRISHNFKNIRDMKIVKISTSSIY